MFTYVNTAFYILDEMLIVENEMCSFFLSCLERCEIACYLTLSASGGPTRQVGQWVADRYHDRLPHSSVRSRSQPPGTT